MRQQSVFHADNIDMGELQPFVTAHRDERHGVAQGFVLLILALVIQGDLSRGKTAGGRTADVRRMRGIITKPSPAPTNPDQSAGSNGSRMVLRRLTFQGLGRGRPGALPVTEYLDKRALLGWTWRFVIFYSVAAGMVTSPIAPKALTLLESHEYVNKKAGRSDPEFAIFTAAIRTNKSTSISKP